MLTRAEIKWLHDLARKRQRDAEGLFIAEGPKVVGDLLALLPCRLLLATADFLQSKAQWPAAE
ncbi:MAG: RNA methyltransferase, partial [Alloprevotella tannerae]|nr:RNA methyltransferase [Alloprevotella tannerae]